MANVELVKKKSILITLSDGIERELIYTLNAMAELEDKYGSVDIAFKKLEEGSMKAIRYVLWAGLLHDESKPLTELQVGSLIDISQMSNLMATMNGAFDADLPEDKAAPLAVVEPVTEPVITSVEDNNVVSFPNTAEGANPN